MKTCYLIVEETGDHYEYYDQPIKVFLTRENAEKFINDDPTPRDEDQLVISLEAYQMAIDAVYDEFPEDFITPLPELIIRTGKFPEWSLNDLKLTEEFLRRKENKWRGYRIDELELCQ